MKRLEEPLRWLDPRSDAPADVRRLIAEGRDALGPTSEELARLGAFVAGPGGGGAAAGAAKAAAVHGGHALTKAGLLKLAAVLAVTGAGGGLGWSVLHRAPAPPVGLAVQPAVQSSPETPIIPPPANNLPAPPAVAAEPTASVTTVHPRSAPVAATGALPPTNATPSPALSTPTAPGVTFRTGAPAVVPPETAGESELALLDRAHARMAADPGGALRALDEHRGRFPQGTFAQEREVLAIEALVRLGRRSEAEARAVAFVGQFPGSAHRRRIAVLLGQDAGP